TAIGEDCPGLVAALASVVDEHGGNWVDSQLALLAGSFAGIVQVELPLERAEDFLAALPALDEEAGLTVSATEGRGERGLSRTAACSAHASAGAGPHRHGPRGHHGAALSGRDDRRPALLDPGGPGGRRHAV